MLAGAAAHANVFYPFDTDVQGFSLVGDGTLVHETAVGNGYLRVTDTNGSTDVYLNLPLRSPPVDWTGYLGGTFAFDAIMLNCIAPSWPDFGTVRLTSAVGEVAYADLAPDVGGVITEPGTTWKTYVGTLNATTFNQGTAPLATVLARLQSVTVSMEAGNGPVEVVGVDNLKVSTVPEPETWALTVAGLLALGARLRARYPKRA